MPYRRPLPVCALLILLAGILPPAAPARLGAPKYPLALLQQAAGGALQVAYHATTGQVRFLGTLPGAPLRLSSQAAGNTAKETARQFWSSYGALFGLKDPEQELAFVHSDTSGTGRSALRYQQVYGGIPVLGGELIVNLDRENRLLSASGEVQPGLALDLKPQVAADEARQTAVEAAARGHGLGVETLTAGEPSLWIYSPALLGAPGPPAPSLVWRVEVRPARLQPVRELVLVDAQAGFVALQFNQADTMLERVIYDNANNRSAGLPGPQRVRSEGSPPAGLADTDFAYEFLGAAYHFYAAFHGRDSLDNNGVPLVATVRYCNDQASSTCPYPNAFWNGEQLAFGQGFADADDVVAHELTHAVTASESKLFYFRQSGAINEMFSDLWGELVDQWYLQPADTPEKAWLIGEDLYLGPGRSMKNPSSDPAVNPYYWQPDKMSSELYVCGPYDRGGVHGNSGVGNKAAYLLAAGGDFNGRSVSGLGAEKVARIFYEAQTHLLTSASDYQDLYNAGQQACSNLAAEGTTTAEDCQQVRLALEAVEMNLQPLHCAAPEAPLCVSGIDPADLFYDDLEDPSSGNWASAAGRGFNGWFYPQTANPFYLDFSYATSGWVHFWGSNTGSAVSDYSIGMTRDIALPRESALYLHFKHAHQFEYGILGVDDPLHAPQVFVDGGVVEFSVDGGAVWQDLGPFFDANGYNAGLEPASLNPLHGRRAFSGDSNGYYSSRANLYDLAGRQVRFRFRIATNETLAAPGWYIDDVRVYACPGEPPTAPGSGHGRVYLPLLARLSPSW